MLVIAEEMHVPLRFLLKILRKLNQAKITKSRRGAKGGYLLYDPERPVTYFEVVEATRSDCHQSLPPRGSDLCNTAESKHCPVHYNLEKVQEKSAKHCKTRFSTPILPKEQYKGCSFYQKGAPFFVCIELSLP